MQIISVRDNRVIGESETKKKDRKDQGVWKGWKLNDFVVHLSFFLLICKGSFIFKLFFNENKYDKFYSSGYAPAHIYGTPKLQKYSFSDSFSKSPPIVTSIGTFNYNYCPFSLQTSFTLST